jgi:hypothetical protein
MEDDLVPFVVPLGADFQQGAEEKPMDGFNR